MSTTENHPNVRVVQGYLAAVGRGDYAAAAAFFTPDVGYFVPGRNRLAGYFTGPQAVMGYFAALGRATGGTYAVTAFTDWLVSESSALLLACERAAIGGHSHDWTRVIAFTIRGGQIADVQLFEDDQYAFDAFLGDVGTPPMPTQSPPAQEDAANGPPQMFGALDDSKVQTVMAYQAAMARGDRAAAATVFDPAVTYHVPGRSALAGDYQGPEAVMGYLGALMGMTGGTYAISQMFWTASDSRVGLATVNHAARDGRRLTWNEVIVFRFEGGKKREIVLYSADPYGFDAFLA